VTRGYIIAGTGTDIGKTHIACALLRLWRAQGKTCSALKPVLSGVEDGIAVLQARSAATTEAGASEDARFVVPNDAVRLLEAIGQTPTPEAVEKMAPWRFKAALAPPAAAALEGQALDFNEIAAACESALARDCAPRILIETAGGLMSPLTERHTMLDLIERLRQPTLFITGSYLGAVSHTLTGVVALVSRGCEVAGVIVSESAQTAGRLEDFPDVLHRHGVSSSIAIVRRGAETQAMEALGRMDLG
jgi:dethiobiotin synthetase